MPIPETLKLQDVLDGIGHSILIFDSSGQLAAHNRMAATLVGTDLKMLRSEGWAAAEALFQPHVPEGDTLTLSQVRREANQSGKPVKFQILMRGEYTPCAAAVITGPKGAVFTLLTVDTPDWTALNDLMGIFRREVKDVVGATRGHIEIIMNSMGLVKPEDPVENLTRRIGGFNQLIDMQMFRMHELIGQMERLEDLRTGQLRQDARQARRKIKLGYWLEDFLEDLEQSDLLDPETEDHDYRGRMTLEIEDGLLINGSTRLLAYVLRDILRNAIMYSMVGTPITIKAFKSGEYVQINVKDEGYGVRQKERERVFAPFKRARQPQIIAEFGYGLSLYLAKQEVEAMNGKLWFDSEEKVGSTFSFKLPTWREQTAETPPSARATQTQTAVKAQVVKAESTPASATSDTPAESASAGSASSASTET